MKRHSELPDLVALLRDDRKLDVGEEGYALAFFKNCNYYRFTGYSRYFQRDPKRGQNQYVDGATLSNISTLMEADNELRFSLQVPLTELEMSLRSRFAHISGRIHGEAAFYLDPSSYPALGDAVDKLIEGIAGDLATSKSATLRRYAKGSDKRDMSEVPIWVAVEVLTFGKISKMIEYINCDLTKNELAASFSFERAEFTSAIHSLATLRNLCAHHAQLWNRNLPIQCPLPANKRLRPRGVQYSPHGLYPALIALSRLVESDSSKHQLERIKERLSRTDEYSNGIVWPAGVR